MVLTAVKGFAGGSPLSSEEIQKKRTITMKAINKHMRQLKVAIGKKQFDRASTAADAVAKLVAQIPELSPKGSAYGPKSRIKPAVWEKFAHYKDLTEHSADAARSLAKVAKSQNKEKVMASFLSLARSCTKCHKPYRKKKRRAK